MPRPEKEPEAPKKQTSTGVLAGRLYERITELCKQEAAEIADAPKSIHERYRAKRAKLVSAAGAKNPDVAAMVMRWLEADAAAANGAPDA